MGRTAFWFYFIHFISFLSCIDSLDEDWGSAEEDNFDVEESDEEILDSLGSFESGNGQRSRVIDGDYSGKEDDEILKVINEMEEELKKTRLEMEEKLSNLEGWVSILKDFATEKRGTAKKGQLVEEQDESEKISGSLDSDDEEELPELADDVLEDDDFDGSEKIDDFLADEVEEEWASLSYEEKELKLKHKKRREKGEQRLEEWYMKEDEEDEEKGEAKRGIPAIMRCFDTAKIYAKSGDGGNGIVAFRREKYVPFGGPSGGNGGRGGSVYVRADRDLNSLLPFRKSVHFRANRGAHGQGSKCHGVSGKDIEILVPPGTIIREASNEDDGEILVELVKSGQRALLLPGGRGGRGNAAFKTSRNNAPQIAENGEEGVERFGSLLMILRLSDVVSLLN